MAKDQDQNDQDTEEKTTKKPKKKSNIDDFDKLKKEFKTGKMVDQKVNALRKKLVSLYKENKITEDEQVFMEAMMRKARLHHKLSSADAYLLNQIESDRCEDSAVVKSDNVPRVLHLQKDLLCKFRFDEEFDDGKNKEDSIGRYIVYIPRTIAPRHQLDYPAAVKLAEKQPLDPSDLPPAKIVIHRVMLKVKEFKKWFEVQDPDILARGTVDPADDVGEYKF